MAQDFARYSKISRQTQSRGMVVLRIPTETLLPGFLERFCQKAVQCLDAGQPLDDLQRQLDVHQLDDDALSAREWLPEDPPSPLPDVQTLADLERSAAVAEDMTAEQGAWRDEFRDLEDRAREAATDFTQRAESALNDAHQDHGPRPLRQLYATIVRRLGKTRQEVRAKIEKQRMTIFASSAQERLRATAGQLRRFARFRGSFKKLLLKIRPNAPLLLWMDDARRSRIKRVLDELNHVRTERYAYLRLLAQRDLLDELLGRSGRPGRLDALLYSVNRQEQLFERLAEAFTPRTNNTPAPGGTELLLVDGPDTVINPKTGRTMYDLYTDRIRRCGASPEQWARQLRTEGLIVDGRPCLPHDWVHFDVDRLARHLRTAAETYLGYQSPGTPVDLRHPQTPYEQIAAVMPTDAELCPLLERIVPALVARSAPYATFRPIAGAPVKPHCLLLCHPTIRAALEPLLLTQLKLSDPKNYRAYATRNPHVVILTQFALDIPGGALTGLWQWMSIANEAHRRGVCRPHCDRRDVPEVRYLDKRVRDHNDCREMFMAARKVGLLTPVGDPVTGYALARSDPRVDHLFAPHRLVPQWHDACSFHNLLNQGQQFVEFVQRVFPRLTTFRQLAHRLAGQLDAETVAEELVDLGILQRGAAPRYRINYIPPIDALGRLPEGLYASEPGERAGLPEDDFIMALLNKDLDLLYNILRWGLCDAVQLGQLSNNDAPRSVLQFLDQLKTLDA